ncbi:MAG: hypothetical protein ACLGIB_02170 [Actinomycetota bacterium]
MTSTIKRLLGLMALAVAMTACSGGINAGGETETSNGGIAFVAMAGMLILTGIILWVFLGRDD